MGDHTHTTGYAQVVLARHGHSCLRVGLRTCVVSICASTYQMEDDDTLPNLKPVHELRSVCRQQCHITSLQSHAANSMYTQVRVTHRISCVAEGHGSIDISMRLFSIHMQHSFCLALSDLLISLYQLPVYRHEWSSRKSRVWGQGLWY